MERSRDVNEEVGIKDKDCIYEMRREEWVGGPASHGYSICEE